MPTSSHLTRTALLCSLLFSLAAVPACAGSPTDPVAPQTPTLEDRDGDGYLSGEGDCDDEDPEVSPAATEGCNQRDDDCDALIDEAAEDSSVAWYADGDGDGFGGGDASCFAPGGGDDLAPQGGDCDDAQPAINPGAAELCGDGLDNDCDGRQPDCGVDGALTVQDADGTFVGETLEDQTGRALSLAGDLDGDGRSDLIITARYGDTASTDAGKAYLLYSPAFGEYSLGEVPDQVYGKYSGDLLGYSVSAGDINRDGTSDLLVGAAGAGETPANVNPGGVYIFHGPVRGSLRATEADAAIRGLHDGDNLAYSVSARGDVNGDGYSDVLIGAPGVGEDFRAGAAYLFYGPLSGDHETGQAAATITGMHGYDRLGFTVDMADLNGDGLDDLIVAAPMVSTYGCNSGAVYIFYGPVYGSFKAEAADAIRYSTRQDDNAGVSLSGGGDVNGDGYDDLLIGASGGETDCGAAPGIDERGYAYLLYGPVEGPSDLFHADVTFEGAAARDFLGEAVMLLSDLDADGRCDVVLGAAGVGSERSDYDGAAYVFYGPYAERVRADQADAIISGDWTSHLGVGLAGGGDVNADGYDDLLVGAYPLGRAYLFLGGPH